MEIAGKNGRAIAAGSTTQGNAKKTAPKYISAREPSVVFQDLLQDLERVAEKSPDRWPVVTVPLIESPSRVPLNSWVISPFWP